MGIAVRPDGTIEVETVEQAIELSKRLAANGATKQEEVRNSKATEGSQASKGETNGTQPWSAFLAKAHRKPEAVRALNVIREKDHITLDELRTELGAASNNVVGGIMSGVTKNAKSVGLKPAHVVKKDVTGTAPNLVITYRAGQMLREAGALK